jgi:uncharacterized protein (TIGR00369 family)
MMKKLNPAHVESLISFINNGPFFKHLSMVIKDIGIGYSLVEVDIENKHNHPFGGVHGGVYCSAIDTAAAWSTYCEVDENIALITLDVNVNILAPVTNSKLIVKGRRIKIGKTICTTEATATNQEGEIVANGTSKLVINRDMPVIQQAFNSFSFETLPPKFIKNDEP